MGPCVPVVYVYTEDMDAAKTLSAINSAAFALGVKAFDAGKNLVPMRDEALKDLFRELCGVTDTVAGPLNAWTEGWTTANRMADVPEWTKAENDAMRASIDPNGTLGGQLAVARS